MISCIAVRCIVHYRFRQVLLQAIWYKHCFVLGYCDHLPCSILYCTVQLSPVQLQAIWFKHCLVWCYLFTCLATYFTVIYRCHNLLLQAIWYKHCLVLGYCDHLPGSVLYRTVQVSPGADASHLIQTLLSFGLLLSPALHCTLRFCTGDAMCCCKPSDTKTAFFWATVITCLAVYCTVSTGVPGAAASHLNQNLLSFGPLWSPALHCTVLYCTVVARCCCKPSDTNTA